MIWQVRQSKYYPVSLNYGRVFEKLRGKDWCTLAVISGRTLHNLIRKVRLEGIIYGGNRHLSLSTMPQNVMPVYIGDDTTDEDAFAAIGQNGFTVVVGNSHRSAAQNSPRNTDEVFKLLEKMFLLRDQ